MSAKRTLPDRICEVCGKEFRQKSSTSGRYCSKACWYRAYDASNQKQCVVCGKVFEGYSRQKTCSVECAHVLRRTAKRNTHCQHCGKPLAPNIHPKVRFCSKSCSMKANRNSGRQREDGARQPHSSGYMMVKVGGKWIIEHRHVMGQLLGRYLEPNERVHHKNGKRADNRPENLELWTVQKKDPAGQRTLDLVKDLTTKLSAAERRELVEWLKGIP